MTEPSQSDHYTQVSAHLQSAGEEVTQLLDLLTEGLALDTQVQRDASHRANTPDGTPHRRPDRTADGPPDSPSSTGTPATTGPRAGEPR